MQTIVTDRILLDVISDKWTLLVVANLCGQGGSIRFNALKRLIPSISQKSLTQCLRRMERNGLVQRHVRAEKVISVEYSFTPLGKTIIDPIKAIYDWTLLNAPAVRKAQAKFDRNVDATA